MSVHSHRSDLRDVVLGAVHWPYRGWTPVTSTSRRWLVIIALAVALALGVGQLSSSGPQGVHAFERPPGAHGPVATPIELPGGATGLSNGDLVYAPVGYVPPGVWRGAPVGR